jgi:hypothetical protein
VYLSHHPMSKASGWEIECWKPNYLNTRLTQYDCDRTTSEMRGFIVQDQLEWFSTKWEHNQHTWVHYHILNSSIGYYTFGSYISLTKVWSPKDALKDRFRVNESGNTFVQYILFALEENVIHWSLSLWILIRCPTLIGLDFPLTSPIDIVGKRRKLLTCTQETTRAKLEQLRSVRRIHGDQKITTRHAKALSKAKGLKSLLAPNKYY